MLNVTFRGHKFPIQGNKTNHERLQKVTQHVTNHYKNHKENRYENTQFIHNKIFIKSNNIIIKNAFGVRDLL